MAKTGYEYIYDVTQNQGWGTYEYWHVGKLYFVI